MKLSFIFIFAALLEVSAASRAQSISLNVRNASLQSVFKMLRKQSGYNFIYNSEMLSEAKNVSIDVNNEPFDHVLEECFKNQPITYVITSHTVVVKKRQTADVMVSMADITVTGIVTDEKGAALPGVNVKLKGSSTGTATDPNGKYSIKIPDANGTLVFSFIGFATQEVPVNGKTTLNIKLTEKASDLNEVVVIGYGQVKKRDLTGSVVSVKGDDVTKVATSSAIEALQGRVPGADIERSNGYAGQGASIRIRGTRSIANPGSSNNVLYIVDGVQGVNIADIDPNDIASVDILKDASSTAIYGSKGANGIIIITTKHGRAGKPKFTFTNYQGFSKVFDYGKFMDGPQYVAFRREANRASGLWSSPADDAKIFNPQELDAINKGQYIDWPSQLLKNGSQQDYQLGVSGGSDKTKAYMSLGYYHEGGIISLDNYQRYNSRLNIDHTINNWLKVGMQSQYTYINNDARRDPFNQASKTPPLGTAFDAAGNFILFPLGGSNVNPLADQQPGAYANNKKTSRFSGSAYVDITPLQGLDIKSTFSTTQSGLVNGSYYGKATIDGKNSKSQSQITNNQSSFISWDNVVTFDKKIQDHSFTLTGITSYLSTVATSSFAGGNNQLLASQLYYNLAAASQNPFYGSGYSKENLFSVAGRLNYGYKGKYLLTFTGRSDGSSKLGEGHKWAFFPSVAGAWRISDESFMHDKSIFSDLKLRLSYGVSGNDVIGAYGTQSSLQQIQFSYNDANAALAYGINPTIGNSELKWELTATKNAGIDFGIFKDRVTGTIDVYNALTSDLIFPYSLPLSTGVTTINRNIGRTRNTGIEIGINTVNVNSTNFSWKSNITFTKNKERIVQLPNGNVIADDYRNSLIKGQSPTIYYDYLKLGIWQTSEAAQAAKYNALPGDIKIADLDNNGKIDGNDRTVIGQRVPKFSAGFNNDLRYKQFDMNILFYGRFKYWISSDYYAKFNRNGLNNGSAIDYWTPENPTNAYPRPSATLSTQYITTLTEREVSFVKLRSVTLGYTLPKSLLSKLKIENVRFYVSAKNPFGISNLKDFDPESEGVIDSPLSKLYLAGVNVTF